MDITIDGDTSKKIKVAAEKEQREPVNIIRRALGLYLYFHEFLNGSNNKLAVIDSRGVVIKAMKW